VIVDATTNDVTDIVLVAGVSAGAPTKLTITNTLNSILKYMEILP